jgi:hypothetical protein
MNRKLLPILLFGLGFTAHSEAVMAQLAEPVAVVTQVTGATVGITSVSVGSTIFSGDLARTEAAGQLQMRSGGVQFVLEPDSSARIFKSDSRILIELEQGSVSYSSPGASESIAIFAQDARFVPHAGASAAGRITIVSPCSVRATVLSGLLDASSGTENKTIEEGKTFSVLPDNAVQYNGAWKPQPSDYPDYSRSAEYHRSHTHVSCAAKESKAHKLPGAAGNPGHFEQVVAGGIIVTTAILVHQALESPDKP